MKKTYYLFNPGRLSRQDNTLKFLPVDENGIEGQARYLPVETIDNIYCFGSLDANSAMYNFLENTILRCISLIIMSIIRVRLCRKNICWREKFRLNKQNIIFQTKSGLLLLKNLCRANNMLKNLQYYQNGQKEVGKQVSAIQNYILKIGDSTQIDELMGLEGNIRQTYYEAYDVIIN